MALVLERDERCSAGHRYGGRLLEREVRRLEHESAAAHVFGEGAVAHAVHLVAGRDVRHILAHRLHDARRIDAYGARLGRADPAHHRAGGIWLAAQVTPIGGVDGGGADTHEHAVVLEHRLLHFLESQHVR